MNSKGIETGSLFTFLKLIKSNANLFNTNKIYIAWDTKLTKNVNFRKVLTEGSYKGTRDFARNKEVYDSMTDVLACTTALGIKNIFPGSLEADDVISWLVKTVEGKKTVVSVDNDFAQLVAEDVELYNPIKKINITTFNFNDIFKLTPKEYIFYKAIVGDVSDNINGLKGFGKVKGINLAKAFAANQQDVIQPYMAQVTENLKLVDLSYGIDNNPEEIAIYNEQYAKLQPLKPDFNEFKNLCTELEFHSILNNFSDWDNTFGKSTGEVIVDFCKLFE